MKPDTIKLIQLLSSVQGNRSIRQWGKDTGVAPTYISGIMKGKYYPSVYILDKLLINSQDGTITVNMLLGSISRFQYDSDINRNITTLINKITPAEISMHIANGDLNEWCNKMQSELTNAIERR